MDLDTFFDECDQTMGTVGSVSSAEPETTSSDSLELMDIFALIDDAETPASIGETAESTIEEEISRIEDETPMVAYKAPVGVTIENITPRIRSQASTILSDSASIKELLTAYFEKYGVSNTEIEFTSYVNKAFSEMFPYCKKCDTYLKKVQHVLIWGYNVGLTEDALDKIGVSTKLQYQKLKLNKRLIGFEEINLLQQATEPELEFIQKFSLTENVTGHLLELYRAEGEQAVEHIRPYLGNKDILEFYVKVSGMDGFDGETFTAAVEQRCVEVYIDSLKNHDSITQTLIADRTYNKVKSSLGELNNQEMSKYVGYHYLDTVITLLDSGFSNEDLIQKYLKEENEIGDYLAKSNDMRMLKLLNQGEDVYYAILAKLYKLNQLEVSSAEFAQYKAKFTELATAYIRNQVSVEDVLLQTVMLLKHPEIPAVTDMPIRDAVFQHVLQGLVIMNSTALTAPSNPPEIYQLISGKSSYVFNVYDFCNHTDDIEHTIALFTDKRKNVKLYRPTPEICIIAFGSEGGANFISEDRHYNCSLKNWCKGSYDKTQVYSVDSLCELNKIAVFKKYQQNFEVSVDDSKQTETWLNTLYQGDFAYKVDLVMDYLLRNSKSLPLLLSEYRQAGLAALSRVLDLNGFNQAFYFLHVLAKGVCNKEPECAIRTQRQPSRSEIVIRSKRYGNKVCTFDSIFTETTFYLLMNELKNATSVKLSYVNSIIIECEG